MCDYWSKYAGRGHTNTYLSSGFEAIEKGSRLKAIHGIMALWYGKEPTLAVGLTRETFSQTDKLKMRTTLWNGAHLGDFFL